jgi:hypothetical protein
MSNGIQVLYHYFECELSSVDMICDLAEKFATLTKLTNGVCDSLIEIDAIKMFCERLFIPNETSQGNCAVVLSNISRYSKGRQKLFNM